jgi:hypothetical protein
MSVVLKSTEIIESLKNLEGEQCMMIDMDPEMSNKAKFLNIQMSSMDNLFKSYINSETELANKFRLDEFLEKYYQVFAELVEVKRKILILHLGYDAYLHLNRTSYFCNYNFDLNKLFITKTAEAQKDNCSCGNCSVDK